MAAGKWDKIIANCTPSRETANDWGSDQARYSGILQDKEPAESRDIATEGDTPSWWTIDDQKDTGACVGYALGGVLKWYFCMAGRMAKSDNLSVTYIWMASKELDDNVGQATTFIEGAGTNVKTGLRIAKKFGVVTENFFSSKPSLIGLYPGNVESFYKEASQLRINSYYNLDRLSDRLLAHRNPKLLDDAQECIKNYSLTLRKWLDQRGPVIVRLDLDPSWMKLSRANGGILTKYDSRKAEYGHCAALTGYKPRKGGYLFRVRNSWGKEWGIDGYGWADEKYAWMAFTEAYGVWVQDSRAAAL